MSRDTGLGETSFGYTGELMKDLTIVIPSLNGEERVAALYDALAPILNSDKISVEIIVFDNGGSFKKEHPHLVLKGEFVNTGEENLLRAIELATGRYIWTLGDDDCPTMYGMQAIEAIVSEGVADLICFNSNYILTTGEVGNATIKCSRPEQIHGLPDFVHKTGLWYNLAGFSNIVYRNIVEYKKCFRKYIEINPIYSHVFAMLETFENKDFRYINIPLVSYAQNKRDSAFGSYWPKLAERMGKYPFWFWVNGFIAQWKELCKNTDAYNLSEIFTTEWGEKRYPITSHIFQMFLNELFRFIWGNKYRITPDEISETLSFLSKHSGKYSIVNSLFRSSGRNVRKFKKHKRFLLNFCDEIWENPLFDYCIGHYRGFNLYYLHETYIGAYGNKRMEKKMQDVSLMDQKHFLCADTEDGVKNKINLCYR